MAVTTHFGGGIGTPIVSAPFITSTKFSTASSVHRGSLGVFTAKLSTATGNLTTKLSTPTMNLRLHTIKTANGPAKMYATPGVGAGDVVLSSPCYTRWSTTTVTTVSTTGRATGWTVATLGGSMSFVGIVSNSFTTIAWMRY